MISEIGYFALIVSCVIAFLQCLLSLSGSYYQRIDVMRFARPAAYTQFIFLSFSFAALTACFIRDDFTVAYVANHSNSLLPIWFKVSAVWGGHEGSLLLWVFLLSGWGAAMAHFSRHLPMLLTTRAIGVMGAVSFGFLLFTVLSSNPFERALPFFPLDGKDLNPLLQDIGLIIHPPMLYMGYVGFSVAFALAIAGLLGGQLDSTWARWARPWTTVAWSFLTVGIALGSWWAYYELGWGGWWFWDPVENASLLPWLSGTALLHSLAATEKRSVFKKWTVLLAITSFSLSLLGTFLVRSGVLNSVHAFASDPERGYFILVLLCVVVGGSLLLFSLRAHRLSAENHFQFPSREIWLLLNNVVFIAAMSTVLLGTLYPLVLEAMDIKVSVGAPYFNRIIVPLSIVMMALLAVGVAVRWKRHESKVLAKMMMPSLGLSIVVGVAVAYLGTDEFYGIVALVLASVCWVVVTHAHDFYKKINPSQRGFWLGLKRVPRSYQGMMLAHMGILMTVVGVTLTSLYNIERDLRVAPGDTAVVSSYTFKFDVLKRVQGENYQASQGVFSVFNDSGEKVAVLKPEKRVYFVQRNTMTEAAISAGIFRDLYVALGEPLNDGAWAVRIYYKPFIRWIWFGALFMALGGIWAISDKRYRLALLWPKEMRPKGVGPSREPVQESSVVVESRI